MTDGTGASPTRELPTGTVTFLFTDVVGSTQLWEQAPKLMGPAMARHDALVERCVIDHAQPFAIFNAGRASNKAMHLIGKPTLLDGQPQRAAQSDRSQKSNWASSPGSVWIGIDTASAARNRGPRISRSSRVTVE